MYFKTLMNYEKHYVINIISYKLSFYVNYMVILIVILDITKTFIRSIYQKNMQLKALNYNLYSIRVLGFPDVVPQLNLIIIYIVFCKVIFLNNATFLYMF